MNRMNRMNRDVGKYEFGIESTYFHTIAESPHMAYYICIGYC